MKFVDAHKQAKAIMDQLIKNEALDEDDKSNALAFKLLNAWHEGFSSGVHLAKNYGCMNIKSE